MEEDAAFAQTSLMTSLRMAADALLIPVWPPLGAIVAARDVRPDGIRYHLMLAKLDLELEISVVQAGVPTAQVVLGARQKDVAHRTRAAILHPFTSGFEDVACVVLTDGSDSSLERALLDLRAALWGHRTYGPDAFGFRQVA